MVTLLRFRDGRRKSLPVRKVTGSCSLTLLLSPVFNAFTTRNRRSMRTVPRSNGQIKQMLVFGHLYSASSRQWDGAGEACSFSLSMPVFITTSFYGSFIYSTKPSLSITFASNRYRRTFSILFSSLCVCSRSCMVAVSLMAPPVMI